MERYLDSRGKRENFEAAYQALTQTAWVDERDAYEFNRDEVVEALSKTLGQSQATCEKWVDNAESNFSLTVENFAKWVKAYLDSKGANRRLIFLVDEVGQFIGNDTHLMLNLQTITEELGTLCQGHAWVVVTSQEDIDAVLGEMKTSKGNDFSKIQGRFKTRLSLSSANVDEVIQERLLAKRDEVKPELEHLFSQKRDILKNQLSFRDLRTTFKQFQDGDDFIKNYPFAPYQFKLLQRIFESIRKAGATGLHLAQGERSLLDAFQSAAQSIANNEVGLLVPLYLFYPSIEGFLDTTVKRTIDHARENPSLVESDVHLLEILFLIRYVDEIKGNVDNLVTLCLNEIDADRLAIRNQIEAGLERLEKQTLISRNGDNYAFLTNEERDVNREIKGIDLHSGEEAKFLGELMFDDLLKGLRKHRFSENKMDFAFNRVCDMQPIGNRSEGALVVSILTPLGDEYGLYKSDEKCVLASSIEGGQVLIRLDDQEILGRELRSYLKTDKYLRTKDDGTLPPTTKRIHGDLAEENRSRRERLIRLLSELFVEGRYFVAGQRFDLKSTDPPSALAEAMEYLIKNTFTKMSYLQHFKENPLIEIQAILRSDDIEQYGLTMDLPENNPQALEDLRQYIELCTKTSRQIVLHDMINDRYATRPFGWPGFEVILLLTRLYAIGEISFLMGGASITHDRVYESITTSGKWRKITVIQKKTADPKELKKARALGKEVFSEMGPEGEDALFTFMKKKLTSWQSDLIGYKALADTGNYPGKDEIDEGLSLIKSLVVLDESSQFIDRFNVRKEDLLDLSENVHDLKPFYEHQKPTWDKLRKAHISFSLNRIELDRDDSARPALTQMGEILKASAPYGMIHEAERLIKTVGDVNKLLVKAQRLKAIEQIDQQMQAVKQDVADAGGEASFIASCLRPFEVLKAELAQQESLAHIAQAESEALHLRDEAVTQIEAFLRKKVAESGEEKEAPKVKRRRVVRPIELVTSSYLETEEEVDSFIGVLRKTLKDALDNDERIEIR